MDPVAAAAAIQDRAKKQLLTPLMTAARYGQDAALLLLLRAGADPGAGSKTGRTALGVAAGLNRCSAARILLDHGAHVDGGVWGPAAPAAVYELTTDTKNRPASNPVATPLMLAVRKGHQELVQLLLDRGADVLFRDEHGRTSLDWAETLPNRKAIYALLEAAERQVEMGTRAKGCEMPVYKGDPGGPAPVHVGPEAMAVIMRPGFAAAAGAAAGGAAPASSTATDFTTAFVTAACPADANRELIQRMGAHAEQAEEVPAAGLMRRYLARMAQLRNGSA